MLSVKKLYKSGEIYTSPLLADERTWVVTPNPSLADQFREGLAANALPALEVLTISGLINKLMSQVQDLSYQRKTKSELLPLLATIWKIKGQSLFYNSFQEIFDLFTELRSFSVQAHLFDEILDLLPGQQGEVVKLFWTTLEEMKILDEHAEVATLAVILKNQNDLELPPNIVITGFNHLNGNQVDFVKALALWADVEVPIQAIVYQEKKHSDYLSWLDAGTDENGGQEENQKKPEIEVLQYGSGRLAETLKIYFKNQSIDHILLCDKKITQSMRMEIPLKDVMVKTECDLFSSEIKKFSDYLQFEVMSSDDEISSREIRKFSLHYKSRTIENKAAPNFRAYKVVELFEKALTDYEQLSVHNEVLKSYDIEVLIEVVGLDQPRVYAMPIGLEKYTKYLYNTNQIQLIPNSEKTLVCLSSMYNPILRTSSALSFEMSQKLSSIGPLQNPRLEYLTKKTELLDLFIMNRVTLLIEADQEESDLGWREILDECEVTRITQKSYKKKTNYTDWNIIKDAKAHYLSASRLQSYKECPRKYYHVYVEPFKLSLEKNDRIEASELGELEHRVIELAYKKNIISYSNELEDFVKHILDEYLKAENKQIPQHQYRIYQDEIYILSSNGLKFVEKLALMPGVGKIEFETKLENLFPDKKEKGSIDLLVTTSQGLVLIDFKRSAGSIPNSASAFIRFEKIQLWFYLKRLMPSCQDLLGLGYLNLSDLENSLLISPLVESSNELNDVLQDLPCRFNSSKFDFETIFKEYIQFEDQYVEKLLNDTDYKIQPEDEASCTYCDVKMICPKRHMEMNE